MDKTTLRIIRQKPSLLGNYLGYKKINNLHSKWLIDCYINNKDIYVLQAHRNAYKTTSIVVVGVIWYLLFNPNKTVLIVRKDFTSASQTMNEIIKNYLSEKIRYLYKKIFDIDFKLTRHTSFTVELSTKTNITKEGSIECAGLHSSLTGRHYDVIICDDIVTIEDRYSKSIREMTKIRFDEFKSIKKQDGFIIVTGTQWHKEDLYSHLETLGVRVDKYPYTVTGILGNETIEILKKTMNQSLFACNYELKHIDTSDKYFNNIIYGQLQLSRWLIHTNYMHIDPAYDGDNYTAITIISLGKNTDKIYINGWVYRKNIYDLIDEIHDIYKKYNIKKAWIETNADKGLIKKEIKKRYNYINIEGYFESGNKHIKIITVIKKYLDRLIFMENIQTDYIFQIVEYSDFSQYDDAPDSLASLLQKAIEKKNNSISLIE